ncbi:MAG TPA: hypothetical protein VER03_25865 [Bryobacteraceae bacterium]|nr:hypothetical protein [Bryobacteraceae bacterium]
MRSVILLRIPSASTDEAAEMLGMSVDVVKHQLHPGWMALKKARPDSGWQR